MSVPILLLRRLRIIDCIGIAMLAAMAFLYWFYGVSYQWDYVKTLPFFIVGLLLLYATAFVTGLIAQARHEPAIDFVKVLSLSTDRVSAYVRVIAPFFVFLLVYDSLHDITAVVNGRYLDGVLIAMDRVLLLGNDVAVLFSTIIPSFLTPWLTISYNSYFLFFIITPFVFVLMGKDEEIAEVFSCVLLACYIGVVGYFAVPCYGPVIAQKDLFSTHFAPGWLIEHYARYKSFYHCFPSLHVAVSTVWLMSARKHIRWLYYLYAPVVVSLWIATMYLRWHYAVDVLAGFLIAGIALRYGPVLHKPLLKKQILY